MVTDGSRAAWAWGPQRLNCRNEGLNGNKPQKCLGWTT